MKSASFQAVAGPDARVLILGTLPGEVSLKKREYYAQPRNAFWQIMSEMVGAELTLPYAERLRRLVTHRIALWDVCHRAMRPGSADSAIQPATIRPNNIYRFLNAHTAVELICFNGAKASALFRRYVVPTLGRPQVAIRREVLPSTSPALAAMSFETKLERWRSVLCSVKA